MAEGKVHIEIDGGSGFCFGVVNAISQAERSLAGGRGGLPGDIVHNRLGSAASGSDGPPHGPA